MQARYSMACRDSARAMCSTLPARRSDPSRFALAAKQMYRLCSNASRDLHRVFAGPQPRRVGQDPRSGHGRAMAEAAVEGTRAWTALGHRERRKCTTYSTPYHFPAGEKG